MSKIENKLVLLRACSIFMCIGHVNVLVDVVLSSKDWSMPCPVVIVNIIGTWWHRRRLHQGKRKLCPDTQRGTGGKRHVLPRYLSGACFYFWSESAISALIAFTKCSPFSRMLNWLVPIISHYKMTGQFSFLSNYVYVVMACTHELRFFCSIGLLLQSIRTLPRYLKPKVGAYAWRLCHTL